MSEPVKNSILDEVLLEEKIRQVVREEIQAAIADSLGGDRLLKVKEVARLLGQSVDWVYRHAQTWDFSRKQGGSLRFSLAGLQKWITENKIS